MAQFIVASTAWHFIGSILYDYEFDRFSPAKGPYLTTMMRLFYGLAVSPAVTAALTAVQNGMEGVRWIAPHNFHLTLRFVGEIDEGLARDLDQTMAERLERRPRAPVDLTVRGLGVLDNRHRRHAVWANVMPTQALTALHNTLETVCQYAGLPAGGRGFRPHITLGVLRQKKLEPRLSARISSLADWPVGTFHADEVILYRSHLSRHGAHYEPMATIPLTGIR